MDTSRHARDASRPPRASEISVPDPILPVQYFERIATRGCDTPEKRLMFAVLLDAVLHIQRGGMAAREVQRWILARDESVVTFEHVCEALDLDATYLARGLLAWYTETLANGGKSPRG